MPKRVLLEQAKAARDDEFYTPDDYCFLELSYWASRGTFIGKRIICPCDSDDSAFVRILTGHKREWGIAELAHSSYNPETETGTDCMSIDYSKYDLVITNPPFSLYPKLMPLLASSGVDYIMVAPFTARHSSWYSKARCQLGHAIFKIVYFKRPDGTTKDIRVDWITSLRDAQEERNELFRKMLKDTKYDPENAKFAKGVLVIDSYKDIPTDYSGEMAVPITVYNRFPDDDYQFIRVANHLRVDGEANERFRRVIIQKK